MTYFTAFNWTIRLNPPYDKSMKLFGMSPWSYRLLQIIKRPSDQKDK